MDDMALNAVNDIRERSKELARADREHISMLVGMRRLRNVTQSDLAEALGESVEWVQGIEAYDSDPRLSELRRYENIVSHFALVNQPAPYGGKNEPENPLSKPQ